MYEPHPQFFRQSVESILSQTVSDLELIIVEDPSSVSGTDILSGIADERIRHIANPRRTSLPEQHNRGLALATGRFICRFDADDVSEPERVERQLAFLEQHADVDVVASALRIIDEEGETVAIRSYPLNHADIIRAFPRWNPIANSAVMFRRQVYDRFGGWRTDSPLPAQDYEWYSRLATGGVRFANLPDPLVRYRIHRRSLKTTRLRETLRSTLETKRRYWLPTMGVSGRLVMAAERTMLCLPPRLVLSVFSRVRYRRVRKQDDQNARKT